MGSADPSNGHRVSPAELASSENRIDPLCKTKLKIYLDREEENRIKSKARSRVGHIFALMKLTFGFVKVRFRGMAKNLNRLQTTCALINLCTACKHLLTVFAQSHA